jgi:hypothetical protein
LATKLRECPEERQYRDRWPVTTSDPASRSRSSVRIGPARSYSEPSARNIGQTTSTPGIYSAPLGAIDSGVTCVLDWSHIHNTPEQTDAAIKALAESGVRAVFAYGNPQNETGRYWEMKGHNFPRTWRVCENNCAKPSGRLEGNDESQMPTLRRDSRDVSAGDIYYWRVAGCCRSVRRAS